LPSAKKMNVQVENCLAAVRIRVDHDAIAVICDALLSSKLSCCQQEMAENFLMFLPSRVE